MQDIKQPLVNQQRVIYKFQCDFCDAWKQKTPKNPPKCVKHCVTKIPTKRTQRAHTFITTLDLRPVAADHINTDSVETKI